MTDSVEERRQNNRELLDFIAGSVKDCGITLEHDVMLFLGKALASEDPDAFSRALADIEVIGYALHFLRQGLMQSHLPPSKVR